MQNLFDPAILFFVFGVIAGLSKSNLEIPPAISKFLSLYLLMAIGLKGGFALAKTGLDTNVTLSLLLAVFLAFTIPLLGYMILRRYVNQFDAAAVAATYGSVSAVTFVTAIQYLEHADIPFGGHMAAAMALMESPAILIAVLLANHLRKQSKQHPPLQVSATKNQIGSTKIDDTNGHPQTGFKSVLHESLTDGAQLLLLGSMAVGILTGESGKAVMQVFSFDLFKGMLAFFMLDMGLSAAKNLPKVKGQSPYLLIYAIIAPVFHALLALFCASLLNLALGDTILLMILAASASYIAVPAVLRYAIPEANPSVYCGLSLGITFPINIVFGIPLYAELATWFFQQ